MAKWKGGSSLQSFLDPTDKLGADVPYPKSHVAYGFAAHVVILDDDGRVKEVYAPMIPARWSIPLRFRGRSRAACSWGWAMH